MTIFNKGDWKVIWNCSEQIYTVFYKGLILVKKDRFLDVKCYTTV